jgi:hypothetical protein
MILIDKIIIDNTQFQFYNGINFNDVIEHPKDGTGGFKFFFINNWKSELESWKRENKINSVLNDNYYNINPIDIENDYISIYQLDGVSFDILYKVIKDKVINKSFINHPWIPISGINKGAWKIGKIRDSN